MRMVEISMFCTRDISIRIRHHDYHLTYFSGIKKILENLPHAPSLVPVVIISAITVKQIQDRIRFVGIFVIMLRKIHIIFFSTLKHTAVKAVGNDPAFRLCRRSHDGKKKHRN